MRRKPYDNTVRESGETLRDVAARMPDDVDYSSMKFTYIASRRKGARGSQAEGAGEVLSGCCICNLTDFTQLGIGTGPVLNLNLNWRWLCPAL